MHASEDEPVLPEEEKDGRWQGKIGLEDERHGKPAVSIEAGVNTNPTFREPGWYSDPLAEGRKPYDSHQAELQKQRAKDRKQKAAQAKAAQSINKPHKSFWSRFTHQLPDDSKSRLPGS